MSSGTSKEEPRSHEFPDLAPRTVTTCVQNGDVGYEVTDAEQSAELVSRSNDAACERLVSPENVGIPDARASKAEVTDDGGGCSFAPRASSSRAGGWSLAGIGLALAAMAARRRRD